MFVLPPKHFVSSGRKLDIYLFYSKYPTNIGSFSPDVSTLFTVGPPLIQVKRDLCSALSGRVGMTMMSDPKALANPCHQILSKTLLSFDL